MINMATVRFLQALALICITIFLGPFVESKKDNVPSIPPAPFDLKLANASIFYSAVAYCGKDAYGSHKWTGPTEGFVYGGPIYDEETDIEGFYGYHPKYKQIWVVYRGTDTIRNWISDLKFAMMDPGYADCAECRVHIGFNQCHENTIQQVLDGLEELKHNQLKKDFKKYKIILTGHSLGAAVATLAAPSLSAHGYGAKLQLYNFGSPRVGNLAFAEYFVTLFDKERYPQRITHHKDIVVHLPYEMYGYTHIDREIYQDEFFTYLKGCEGADDPLCAQQWSIFQTDISDHMTYLNHSVTGDCGTPLTDV